MVTPTSEQTHMTEQPSPLPPRLVVPPEVQALVDGLYKIGLVEQLFPIRVLLRDPASANELRTIVLYYGTELLRGSSMLTLVKMSSQLQESLCGSEPLTTQQLVVFLNAVASVSRQLLADRAHRAKVEAGNEPSRAKSECETTVAIPETMVIANRDAASPQEEELRGGRLAEMTLDVARQSPDQILSRLAALDSLEPVMPEAAKWFQFVEFTGSTIEEISKYYGISEESVERGIDLFVADLLQQSA